MLASTAVLAALGVALLLAAADPGPPSSRFDELVQKAKAAYADASFDVALSELLAAEAVATTDRQRVIVWLAQGVVLANVPNLDAASAAWERGLALDPDAALPLPASPKVRAEFEKLQRIVKRVRAKAEPPPAASPAVPAAPVEARRPGPVEVTHVTLPAVLTGVLAVAGIGAGFGLAAMFQGLDSSLAATPRPAAQVEAALSQRDALRAGAITAWAAGGLLAAISVALFIRGAEVPAVALVPAPGGGVVAAALRF